jgi:hypothetical protein
VDNGLFAQVDERFPACGNPLNESGGFERVQVAGVDSKGLPGVAGGHPVGAAQLRLDGQGPPQRQKSFVDPRVWLCH